MVREDAARWTADLTPEQLWHRPYGLAPAGFHLRHLGRSAVRLMTYATGSALTPAQLAALETELMPGESVAAVLAELEDNLRAVEALAGTLSPDSLLDPRGVGRQQLPSTVLGLVWHTAEHAQRHLGQAVTTAALVRAMTAYPEPGVSR